MIDESEKDVIYGRSPITGRYYKITEWERTGLGNVKALEKEEVDKGDIPQPFIETIEQ